MSARGDDAVLRAHAFCPGGATELSLALDFLAPFPAGHRHLAHVRAGRVDEENVLRPSAHTLRTETGAPVGDARAASIGSFMRLGIEHILTGYDHLVFLFGLVVIGGEPRSLVKAITAFTVAHSLSLALAVLDVWTPSPRFIEPAIALSIAYVGVENFFVRDASTRWRVTLPFGFIHGFGFAGALMERHLPPSRVPPALLGFNAGVELGQLALLAVVLPLVMVGSALRGSAQSGGADRERDGRRARARVAHVADPRRAPLGSRRWNRIAFRWGIMPRRDMVVIGASAGGVEALHRIIGGLPSSLPAAVLIVLHVPPGTPSALPAILARAAGCASSSRASTSSSLRAGSSSRRRIII